MAPFVSQSHSERATMNIDDLNMAERRNGFLAVWAKHKLEGFAATQAEANKIAADWGIEAPQIAARSRPRPPIRSSEVNRFGGF